jgi:hypothetical protein
MVVSSSNICGDEERPDSIASKEIGGKLKYVSGERRAESGVWRAESRNFFHKFGQIVGVLPWV